MPARKGRRSFVSAFKSVPFSVACSRGIRLRSFQSRREAGSQCVYSASDSAPNICAAGLHVCLPAALCSPWPARRHDTCPTCRPWHSIRCSPLTGQPGQERSATRRSFLFPSASLLSWPTNTCSTADHGRTNQGGLRVDSLNLGGVGKREMKSKQVQGLFGRALHGQTVGPGMLAWVGTQRLDTPAVRAEKSGARRTTRRYHVRDHNVCRPTDGDFCRLTWAVVCRQHFTGAGAVKNRRNFNVAGERRGGLIAQSQLDEHEKAAPDRAPSAPASGQVDGFETAGTGGDGAGMELFCTGLPTSWNRDELRLLFEPLGAVTSVVVPQHVSRSHDGLSSLTPLLSEYVLCSHITFAQSQAPCILFAMDCAHSDCSKK